MSDSDMPASTPSDGSPSRQQEQQQEQPQQPQEQPQQPKEQPQEQPQQQPEHRELQQQEQPQPQQEQQQREQQQRQREQQQQHREQIRQALEIEQHGPEEFQDSVSHSMRTTDIETVTEKTPLVGSILPVSSRRGGRKPLVGTQDDPDDFLTPLTAVDQMSLACRIFCKAVIYPLVFIIFVGIPVSMIVVGTLYICDCKGKNYLPIFLIVVGVAILIDYLCFILACCSSGGSSEGHSDGGSLRRLFSRLNVIMDAVVFVLLIVESVIVFSDYYKFDFDQPSNDKYCHPLLYQFAFWLLVGFYVCILIVLFWFLCRRRLQQHLQARSIVTV